MQLLFMIRSVLPCFLFLIAKNFNCFLSASYKYLMRIRRGKKTNMVLVLRFLKMCARVREIFFFTENFYQLTNIDLPLNETKSHFFIATLYFVCANRRHLLAHRPKKVITKIPYLFTSHDGFPCDQRKGKMEQENKKTCRARSKSRARGDQNHIFFYLA